MEQTKLERHDNLIRQATEYQVLKEVLYHSAELSWKDDMLRFDSDAVSTILKALDYETYADVCTALKNKAVAEAKAKADAGEPMD